MIKRTSMVISSSKSVSCFISLSVWVFFFFLKISLLMAKCQKSENFLSELQQAFSQAKRSVQEQMVRQLKPRDHLNSTVCLTFGAQCVCKRLCLAAQPSLARESCAS